MKRTPLRRVSLKQAKKLEAYRKLRTEFLHENRLCEAGLVFAAEGIETGCTKWATQIHHRAKRGKNLNNTATWLPCCARCHEYIESNKSLARELGLLKNIHEI